MRFIGFLIKLVLIVAILFGAGGYYLYSKHSKSETTAIADNVVVDETGLNRIQVSGIAQPINEMEIVQALEGSSGPVSIGGARYSMGGQTAYPDSIHLDMRRFNQVIDFDPQRKQITVQSGITWRELQEYIDPHDLSVMVMQDFNNFTVGGSLSVNAHGRFVKRGAIINSVKRFRIVLADGQVYEASPGQNSALFFGAIGGYGGLGVISHVTLQLVDNVALERSVSNLQFHHFLAHFSSEVLNDPRIELHHAVLYPPAYESLSSISWRRSDEPLTETRRLREPSRYPVLKNMAVDLISESNFLKRIRKNLIDPYLNRDHAVVWRNWETSYDLEDMGFISTEDETLALRIYFVPFEEFEIFVLKMRDIFIRHDASVLNVSIRFVPKDPGSLLAWAREDSFSFAIIYHQYKNPQAMEETRQWSSQLIQAAIDSGGSYYLPFQLHETTAQFAAAYPDAGNFFRLKEQADPANRFRNMLWLEHYAANSSYKETLKAQNEALEEAPEALQPVTESDHPESAEVKTEPGDAPAERTAQIDIEEESEP